MEEQQNGLYSEKCYQLTQMLYTVCKVKPLLCKSWTILYKKIPYLRTTAQATKHFAL